MESDRHIIEDGTPDRHFERVTAIILAVVITMVFTSHALLQYGFYLTRQADNSALVSATEAANARMIISDLDRLTVLPDGRERRTAAAKLRWDFQHLSNPNNTESFGEGSNSAPMNDLTDLVNRALDFTRDGNIPALEAEGLKWTLLSNILPQLDIIANDEHHKALVARNNSQFMLVGSLALNIVVAISLAYFIVLPTRRKVTDWVSQTNENDRETQFKLLHDTRTGMPNAAYLQAYVARQINGLSRDEKQMAIMRVEFDRFKILLETLGARIGDEVIRIAARRLQKTLRGGDFAAYLGGHTFVVVSELKSTNDAASVSARIQMALSKPFSIRGNSRKITCSMGIALLSDGDDDPETILGNAAIALAEAQAEDIGTIRYFNEEQRAEVERRETLYGELVTGLEDGSVVPYFQPQISLIDGSFMGFEALVRWNHPTQGVLSPAAFLDFAEQTDLTERIGEVVLTRSLEALQEWDRTGFDVPQVGINFALAQLRNPRLIEKIKWETEKHDVEPSKLAIEVLETVLIKSDADIVVRNLRGLASAGFVIDLDDFGTGHASISNLRRFMVDRIKIDRSFVFGIESNEEQQQLTASMVAMAKALGIEILAEGVETEEAELMLRQLGCDYCQGYLIAKPMSFADTLDWMAAYTRRPYGKTAGEEA